MQRQASRQAEGHNGSVFRHFESAYSCVIYHDEDLDDYCYHDFDSQVIYDHHDVLVRYGDDVSLLRLVITYNSIRGDENDECYDFAIVYDDDDDVIFSSGSL